MVHKDNVAAVSVIRRLIKHVLRFAGKVAADYSRYEATDVQ